jgi:hypothetical protein
VSSELIGAVRQLAAILRRNWSLSGQPPSKPCWYFELPTSFRDDKEWELARKFTHDNALFGCLSAETFEALLIEAVPFIPPLKEAGIVIDEVKMVLAKPNTQASRFRYLFKQFCDRQWASGPCRDSVIRFEPYKEEHFVGYGFEIVEEQLISDMVAAAEESLSEPQIASHDLTQRETTVLEAIGEMELSAEELAKIAGYPCNSAFRTLLSTMKKRGLLLPGSGGIGYRRGSSQ